MPSAFDPRGGICDTCGKHRSLRDGLCHECEVAELDANPIGEWPDAEPSRDDSVRFCPDCERPNQFGELCYSCQREQDAIQQAVFHG